MKTSTTTRRAIVHITLATILAILVWVLSRGSGLGLIIGLSLVVLLLDFLRLSSPKMHLYSERLFKPFLRNYESTRFLGATYLLLGCLATTAIFPKDIAVLAISYLAVGDALATVVGESMGKHKLFKKSIEGSLACLFGCCSIGLGWFFSGIGTPLVLMLFGAMAATVAELLPLPIDDNVSLPVLSGLIMFAIRPLFA